MLFAVICTDREGGLELRKQTRPAHLEYLRDHESRLVQVGPVLNAAGEPEGSLLIIDATSLEEAQAFAAGDPYAQAGLFATVTVRAYRQVFKDGQFVG
ncbi:putative cytosolic protein [Granulibacter bethesdensis]|uniref:Cytosolic protein n=1 Tax=Granulibacter bethesdensis TaxID=364410 RepID=A0AAC9P7I4_9PROT|nr:YciI family protein [Granulibacter bethesdensis]APH53496.1 putative cytosolic protein [Granulibacter bethesdensis]APH61074.1 putative cytosolic protein [Granulibacter bethesdensis]